MLGLEQGIPPAQDIPDYPPVTSRESPRPFLGMRGKPGCLRCEAAAAAAGFGFVDTGINPGISGVGRDLKAHPIPQGTPSTGPMWTNPIWMNPTGTRAAGSAWNGSGAREWDVPAPEPGNGSGWHRDGALVGQQPLEVAPRSRWDQRSRDVTPGPGMSHPP